VFLLKATEENIWPWGWHGKYGPCMPEIFRNTESFVP